MRRRMCIAKIKDFCKGTAPLIRLRFFLAEIYCTIKPMICCYARVFTDGQSEARKYAILAAGAERCSAKWRAEPRPAGHSQAAPPLGWVCADPTENLLFVSKAILVTPAECTNRRADTSVINFLDRCAITVPIRTVGPPVGLMIVGEHGGDRHLLGVGRGIEAALNRTL
jgi:hypothetical protein